MVKGREFWSTRKHEKTSFYIGGSIDNTGDNRCGCCDDNADTYDKYQKASC